MIVKAIAVKQATPNLMFYIEIIYSHSCEAGHFCFKLHIQLGLSPCYRLGSDLFQVCLFWVSGWRDTNTKEALLVATAKAQEEKPNHMSLFHFCAANMSAKLSLAKPSNMARPKIKVQQSTLHPPGGQSMACG